MKLFVDCEFIDNGHTVHLLSVGVARGDGARLYGETSHAKAWAEITGGWIARNVAPYLSGGSAEFARDELAELIRQFAGDRPEWWGYCSAYDWVCIGQLFGPLTHKPPGWPWYCRDLKQWADQLGVGLDGIVNDNEHHALSDACWNLVVYKHLDAIERGFANEARLEIARDAHRGSLIVPSSSRKK